MTPRVTILAIFAAFFALSASPLVAVQESVCETVVLTGIRHWKPYTFVEQEGIRGLGVDVANLIFTELDLPTKVIQLNDDRQQWHALRRGDIDVVVSTYDYKDMELVLDIIEPGYLEDPLSIAISSRNPNAFNSWDELIGSRGVVTNHFKFQHEFEIYRDKYLYIHPRGDLEGILGIVGTRKADYVIGSLNQLKFGLKEYAHRDKLKINSSVRADAEVHMAFAKNSKCHVYMPYVARRLKQLRQAGTIRYMLAKYTGHNGAVAADMDIDADGLFDIKDS